MEVFVNMKKSDAAVEPRDGGLTKEERSRFFGRIEEILRGAERKGVGGVLFVRNIAKGAEAEVCDNIQRAFPRISWLTLGLNNPESWVALQRIADRDEPPPAHALLLYDLPRDDSGEVEPRAVSELARLAPVLRRWLWAVVMVVNPPEIEALNKHAAPLWQSRLGFVAWPAKPTPGSGRFAGGGEDGEVFLSPPLAEKLLPIAAELFRVGEVEEAYRQAGRATRVLLDASEHRLAAEGLYLLAMIAEKRRDNVSAIGCYEKALELYGQTDDSDIDLAITEERLGHVYFREGRMEQALTLFRRALERDELRGDELRTATGYRHLALALERLDQRTGAEEFVRRSLELEEKAENHRGMARCHIQLGRLTSRRGRFIVGTEHLTTARQLCEELKDQGGLSTVLHELGNVHLMEGLVPEAIDFYRQAVQLDRETGDTIGFARGSAQLGHALALARKETEALRYLLYAHANASVLGAALAKEVMERIRGLRALIDEQEYRRIVEEVARPTNGPSSAAARENA